MSRRYDPRRAKAHRTYSVRELTKLFNVGVGTVSAWVADGLRPCDGSRPYLFRGEDIRAYFEQRIAKARRPCGPGKIFCIACKAVKAPVGQRVLYRAVGSKSANLIGECPSCGRSIYRRVSIPLLGQVLGNLHIHYENPQVHINGCTDGLHTRRSTANE